jgi:cysteine desulfurase/selenocysteine lyase
MTVIREKSPPLAANAPLDVAAVRADFPILSHKMRGKPLVYLDNGNTTQKPQAVIDATSAFYSSDNANIHRGNYELSQHATDLYGRARRTVRSFINAAEDREIIFTRGTTESINLVAASFGGKFIGAGDEIILSAMEHHSDIVPWQILAERVGAKIHVIPMNDAGELDLDEFRRLLSPRTKMVAVVHLSNSLGTINDVTTIARLAHAVGAKVLVDGAQWTPHHKTDVRAIDCDFYVFSGHKLYGPTGIGVLYGKAELLEAMPPYQGGGDMIHSVTFAKTTYAELPFKFEAGTPNIAGAVGLGAAIDYVNSVGMERIEKHERELFEHATRRLAEVPGLRLIGTAKNRAGVVSFVIDGQHPHDIGTMLDLAGIAVRTGHHCCQPVMDRFKIPATVRVTPAMYNTKAEIDTLVTALKKIVATAPAAPVAPSMEEFRNLMANRAREMPKLRKIRKKLSKEIEEIGRDLDAFKEDFLADAFSAGEPAAGSPQVAAAELAESFQILGDWEQRHQYLLDLGSKLPPLPDELRTEPNRVHGCMSTVFLSARPAPGDPNRLIFLADSDAHIVRGLIAVLRKVFNGQRGSDILAFDTDELFRSLGLDQALSMGRRNGLSAMVKRIKTHAAQLGAS